MDSLILINKESVMELVVDIKYHNPKFKLEKLDIGDWIDLRSAENVELSRFEDRIISLGVSMRLPEGYEAHIAPRSGTYKRWGIIMAGGIGVIDNSYSGTNDIWKFPAIALRDTKIYEGDRICQFRIVKKQPDFRFNETDKLGEINRGGFGSTGSR